MIKKTTLLFLLLMFSAGCYNSTAKLVMKSNKPDTTFYIENKKIGTGEVVTYELENPACFTQGEGRRLLTAQLPGYSDATARIQPNKNNYNNPVIHLLAWGSLAAVTVFPAVVLVPITYGALENWQFDNEIEVNFEFKDE